MPFDYLMRLNFLLESLALKLKKSTPAAAESAIDRARMGFAIPENKHVPIIPNLSADQ